MALAVPLHSTMEGVAVKDTALTASKPIEIIF